MGIWEAFLIKLLFTQLTIGDQLQDEGHERTMPQLDPMMMKQLVENMKASKVPMVQALDDRIPVDDFSNFFTGDPSGGEEGDGETRGAKSDLDNSLGDYSAPNAAPLMQYQDHGFGSQPSTSFYNSPANPTTMDYESYEAPSNSYAAPTTGYMSPSTGYNSPSDSYGGPPIGYGAPSSSFGAPASTYDQPNSYEVPLTDQSLTPLITGSYESPNGQDIYSDYLYDPPSGGYGYSGGYASHPDGI